MRSNLYNNLLQIGTQLNYTFVIMYYKLERYYKLGRDKSVLQKTLGIALAPLSINENRRPVMWGQSWAVVEKNLKMMTLPPKTGGTLRK